MWSAKIASKDFKGGSLHVNVAYLKDTESFNEVYDVTNAFDLDRRIRNRLTQLEETDGFSKSLALGDYILAESKQTKTPLGEFNEKIGNLQRLKSLVDLGVIKQDDPEYISALAEAKDKLPS